MTFLSERHQSWLALAHKYSGPELVTSLLSSCNKPNASLLCTQNPSPKYLQIAISLLLTKITVFIFLVTSPVQRFWKLLVPLLLCKARTDIFLVILLYQEDG